MSVTSFGIPLPFGQTLRPANLTACPYHCSAGPDYFTLTQNDTNLQIMDIRNDIQEIQTAGDNVDSQLFTVMQSNNVLVSNVDSSSVLDGSTVIQNAEINLYATITGTIDLNTIRFGTTTLNASIASMLRYWEWKICQDYDITVISTFGMSDIVYSSLVDILSYTYDNFINLTKAYVRFDLSAYANLINSCFSSVATLASTYIEEGTLPLYLNTNNKFKDLDGSFYFYYKNNPELLQFINAIVGIAYEKLMDISNSESFISRLLTVNKTVKKLMGNLYDPLEFNNYLCGKIGAVSELSYLLDCTYNIGPTSASQLIMLFALPQKFLYV